MHAYAPKAAHQATRAARFFLPLGRLRPIVLAVGLWGLSAPACTPRTASDSSGNGGTNLGQDGSRPESYGNDPTLAPIVGGNATPGDGNTPVDPTTAPTLGDDPNNIAFTPASALFVPADANDTGPTLYLYAQQTSCSDLSPTAPARQGLTLQLQFADKVVAGSFDVITGAGDTLTSMGIGQANAALLNNGTALLDGAVGEVVVSTSSATSLELSSVQLLFGSGQTLRLGQVEAQVCASGNVLTAPAVFAAAAAYFTQGAGGVGPILSLVDLPITCANLRAPGVELPEDASLLRVYLGDASFHGNYGLLNTNAVGTGSLSAGKASARMSRPKLATTATTGNVGVQAYSKDSTLSGTVTATLGDGTQLDAVAFVATYCP